MFIRDSGNRADHVRIKLGAQRDKADQGQSKGGQTGGHSLNLPESPPKTTPCRNGVQGR